MFFWEILNFFLGAENEKKHPKNSEGFEGFFRHFLK
jgi:hypothetical protein